MSLNAFILLSCTFSLSRKILSFLPHILNKSKIKYFYFICAFMSFLYLLLCPIFYGSLTAIQHVIIKIFLHVIKHLSKIILCLSQILLTRMPKLFFSATAKLIVISKLISKKSQHFILIYCL